jgi:hypothetical protein
MAVERGEGLGGRRREELRLGRAKAERGGGGCCAEHGVVLGSEKQRRGRTSNFGVVLGSKRLDAGLGEVGRWTWKTLSEAHPRKRGAF